MRDLILWMTQLHRRKRPQTVGEILQYLKEGGGTKAFDSDDDDTTFHRGKSSAGKGQTPPPTRKQEFNPLYVLIGVVVVLGIILAVWFSSKKKDGSPIPAVDTTQVELPADSVAPSSTEQQEKEVQEEAYTLDATEFFSNTIWKPAKTLPVYGSQECVSKTDQIGTNVKFEVLSAKYYFYSFIEAKVTKNFPSGFSESECKDNLPVGSTIKLLFCEGECIWNVLLDGQLNFALFAFELDKRLLTESPYDGCHKIGGTITKPTEHKKLMMKIKYKGKVGWIKMENNGAYEDPPILLDY